MARRRAASARRNAPSGGATRSTLARKLLDAGADPHMARDDGASVFNTGSACDIQEFAGPGKNHT